MPLGAPPPPPLPLLEDEPEELLDAGAVTVNVASLLVAVPSIFEAVTL
jgi:hypothetical protein